MLIFAHSLIQRCAMKSLMLLATALGVFLLAPVGSAAPKPKDDAKDDLKKLEGNWQFTTWVSNGTDLPQEQLEICKWSVKGDKYNFEMGGENKEEGTIKLDPAKKPATIDLDIKEGNDKGKAQPGIYKIEGDTVTICLARPGAKDRPTEFSGKGEDGHILITMKRMK